MKPNESFLGQSIRSLQTMLRVIAQLEPNQPSVIPDGIYGQNTVAAVAAFQRRKGLPQTGIVDQQTWDSIVLEYEPALILVGDAYPIEVIWEVNEVVGRGQTHPNLYLAQSMLLVLSQAYSSIPAPIINGILDLPTESSLSAFQQLQQLPVTGQLDKITWQNLAKQYPLAASLLLDPGRK